ncbi:MAG: hypothetical protein ACLQVL_21695 [Terriglobia bacterium]
MQAQEIRFAQKRRGIHVLGAKLLFNLRRGAILVIVQDAHGEPARAACHRLADASKAINAQGFARGISAPHTSPRPIAPLAFADEAVSLYNPSGHSHEKREAEVSRRLCNHTGSIG